MSAVAHLNANAVAGGFYMIREAARLLQMPSARTVRGWLAGHTHSGAGPIIPLLKIEKYPSIVFV